MGTVLVQIAGSEATRDWRTGSAEEPFAIQTLAPNAEVSDRLASQRRAMRKTLRELRPAVVAVAGYDRPEMREALAWGRHVNDHRDAWEIVRRADHANVGLVLDTFHTLIAAPHGKRVLHGADFPVKVSS